MAVARDHFNALRESMGRCGGQVAAAVAVLVGWWEEAAWALWNLSWNSTNLAAMKDLGYGKKSFFGGCLVCALGGREWCGSARPRAL